MQAVIHLWQIDKSTLISGKIAELLADLTGAKLCDRGIDDQVYDRIFVVNSPSAFCGWIQDAADAVGRAKEVVYVMNDYLCYPFTQMRRALGDRKIECWSTLDEHPAPHRKTMQNLQFTQYVNWNALTWDPQPLREPKWEGLFYYGAFRLSRLDLLKKYLLGDVPYQVHISGCGRKAMRGFFEENPGIWEYPPMKNPFENIGDFQATVYIEDKTSRQIFTSPANRFYECASAGIPIFFDSQCLLNVCEEVDPGEWTVNSAEEVSAVLRDPEKLYAMRHEQADHFRRRDYRQEVLDKLKEIL